MVPIPERRSLFAHTWPAQLGPPSPQINALDVSVVTDKALVLPGLLFAVFVSMVHQNARAATLKPVRPWPPTWCSPRGTAAAGTHQGWHADDAEVEQVLRGRPGAAAQLRQRARVLRRGWQNSARAPWPVVRRFPPPWLTSLRLPDGDTRPMVETADSDLGRVREDRAKIQGHLGYFLGPNPHIRAVKWLKSEGDRWNGVLSKRNKCHGIEVYYNFLVV